MNSRQFCPQEWINGITLRVRFRQGSLAFSYPLLLTTSSRFILPWIIQKEGSWHMMEFLTVNFYFINVYLSVDRQWCYVHVIISAYRGQKKALDPPGAAITSGCELPTVGAGKQTQVPCKSSQHS